MAQLKSTNITGNLAVTGSVLASKIIKLGGTANEILCADGSTTTLSSLGAGTVTSVTVTGNNGLTGTGTVTSSGTITLSHANTSDVANLTAANRTYVKSLTFDTYGHVTGYTTGTETVTDSNTTYTFASGTNGFSVTPSGGSAQSVGVESTKILRQDTRNANPAPYEAGYANMGYLSLHLKTNSAIGITGQNTYSALLEIYPWGDSSGGAAHQLVFGTNGAICHRYGTSSWSSWQNLATQSWVGDQGYLTSHQSLAAYVQGPSSATDNAIVRFNGTGGKTVQNSRAILDDTGNLKINNSDGGDITLELARGANADWRFVGSGGNLYVQSNYTSSKGSYYNVLSLAYNSGAATFKGTVTTSGLILATSGGTAKAALQYNSSDDCIELIWR